MSIYDNIRNGKYQNTWPYPMSPKPPTVLRMLNNALVISPTEISIRERLTKQHEVDLNDYKFKKRQYERHCSQLTDSFANDCYDDLGISKNPKKEMLFRIAWDISHSSGYAEVYNMMMRLCPLITESKIPCTPNVNVN